LSKNFKKRSVFGHVFGTPLRKCADVTTIYRKRNRDNLGRVLGR
jgi:hypothetical protein